MNFLFTRFCLSFRKNNQTLRFVMLNVEKLKILRDAKMKQGNMATELKMSQSNYSKIEN
jgi:hypothetical protein